MTTLLIFAVLVIIWVALTLLITHSSQRGRIDQDRMFMTTDTVIMSPERLTSFKKAPLQKSGLSYSGYKVIASKLMRPKTGWDYEKGTHGT